MKRFSSARAAPSPSNTAPKARAARINQRNMADTSSVCREVLTSKGQLSRRLAAAARVAAVAPTAELSTRLVYPKTNSPVMKKKIRNGMMPARSSLSFSAKGMFSSSSFTVGASEGFSLQRMTM